MSQISIQELRHEMRGRQFPRPFPRTYNRVEPGSEPKSQTRRVESNAGKDVENLRRFLQRNNTADEFLKSLPKPAREVPDEPAAAESSEQRDGVE